MKKKRNKYIPALLWLTLPWLLPVFPAMAQDNAGEVKKFVTLQYFNTGNSTQYLLLTAVQRTDQGVFPQQGISFSLYMDGEDAAHLVGENKTDKEGKAKYFIPPTLQEAWKASARHLFTAGSTDDQHQETEIIKGKISIDTLNEEGERSIRVQVMKMQDSSWVPAPEVDVKVGIKRLGGILASGDEPVYTTDSSGMVTAPFTKEHIPGDTAGNIILAARVEDNDELGNLLCTKTVKWGKAFTPDHHFFDQRTLWSTRTRTPFWLLGLAYSIILGVWGTLIYLFFQLLKIRKLGRNAS